jgi:Common central domain of tyrosinase
MGVRKNAKFLTPSEREAFVQACVLMKADIVNPGAGVDEYSRWDEFVALHRFIQNVNTPGNVGVNFGHGGLGAYGFLSWHRYFLYRLEQQLQSYVAGVMLPYWDWTDPAGTIVVEDFLGPNGDPLVNNEVQLGYFAADAPGTGANTTAVPVWWPGTLTGFRLHAAFGIWEGPLRRNIQPPAGLPSAATLRSALNMGTLPAFQNACESGAGTVPAHGLHNTLHGWFGGGGHMGSVAVSPFDPMFYLHHCNVDRLWAMWQMDGHADEFPMAGGDPEHHRTDRLYPWVGALAGYSSNYSLAPIVVPDFSGEPAVTHEDVLDHRALGYSYDVQAVIGIALDRTGSMMGLTPDPMTSPAPDVTKWEAAKLGVSAFLLDCETAYDAAEAYVVAGVKTFRQLAVGEFTPVFAGDPYGLVKPGGSYSSTSFDAAIAGLAPGGGTPLADALTNVHATLVSPPFGWLPADERRYLAVFTDGMQTAGSPINSIGDGSLTNTAIFAMGFGTGADVDYVTLQDLVDKGETLGITQVFQGENAGAIDKFYSQSLAAAMGFTPIMDPVTELHAGEHEHLQFTATSADDVFFITAQGMDFQDDTWSFQLIGPDGDVAYTAGSLPPHSHGGHGGGHGGPRPLVTARRRRGRLSLFLKRNNADTSAWVGTWYLLVAWRARLVDAMVMLDAGELMVPVSAGPIRGARYARLLVKPERRIPARAVRAPARHRLDVRPTSTNLTSERACSVVVNVYARTRLRTDLRVERHGDELSFTVATNLLRGAIGRTRAFGRLIAPTREGAGRTVGTPPGDAARRVGRHQSGCGARAGQAGSPGSEARRAERRGTPGRLARWRRHARAREEGDDPRRLPRGGMDRGRL